MPVPAFPVRICCTTSYHCRSYFCPSIGDSRQSCQGVSALTQVLSVGDFHSASEHLEKAVRFFQTFPKLGNNLACAYIYLKDFEKALIELRQVIALNPNSTHHITISVQSFSRSNAFPKLRKSARYALELNPQRNASRYDLGLALAAQYNTTWCRTGEGWADGRRVRPRRLAEEHIGAAGQIDSDVAGCRCHRCRRTSPRTDR